MSDHPLKIWTAFTDIRGVTLICIEEDTEYSKGTPTYSVEIPWRRLRNFDYIMPDSEEEEDLK